MFTHIGGGCDDNAPLLEQRIQAGFGPSLLAPCDGVGGALGHPRVYLRMDPETGFVECGYCDRRFVLEGGPADRGAA